jgi:glycerophosphoryl diester phosphodiesterase
MRAFRRAAEVGCDLVELDVHLSADDVPVVIHDETLDRTTDGRGLVRAWTWSELRRLDAGRGERLPTLEEVCAWAREAGATLSCEIKQPTPALGLPRYEPIAERVVEVLRAHGLARRALVHSFDHPTVRQLRQLAPELTAAVSYGGGTFLEPLALGHAADASGIHPWWAWVSPEVCEQAHAAGMHVHAWGIAQPPRPEQVAPLVRAGVDSLDADDPRLLRALLGMT